MLPKHDIAKNYIRKSPRHAKRIKIRKETRKYQRDNV